ncbi:hypothetical protein MMC10_002479 [Thelotrema lepadinum]|nr:hypothetical protein [Thelotrema lepadinum]
MDLINTLLPPEILTRILEYAHKEQAGIGKGMPKILLVCHHWTLLAEPIVWRELKIRRLPQLFRNSERGKKQREWQLRAIDSLKSYPRFRQYTRELDFDLYHSSRSSEAAKLMEYCQNLVVVSLHAESPYSDYFPVDSLRGLPRLQEVYLRGFRTRSKRDSGSTECAYAKVALPVDRQEGNLRSLCISDMSLGQELVNYLLSLPLTLESFSSSDLYCPGCDSGTCARSLQQRLLETHHETLSKVTVQCSDARRPEILDFSSMKRLRHLCISAHDLFFEDPKEAYRKLSAPLIRRIDLSFALRYPEHTLLFEFKELAWMEMFLSTLKSTSPYNQLSDIHLYYHPDIEFKSAGPYNQLSDMHLYYHPDIEYKFDLPWPWGYVLEAEESAANMGFKITHDEGSFYTKEDWEKGQRGELPEQQY